MPLLMWMSVTGPAEQWYMKTPGVSVVLVIVIDVPGGVGPYLRASILKACVSRPWEVVPLLWTLIVTVSPSQASIVGPGRRPS
jgi:hypothetical protein